MAASLQSKFLSSVRFSEVEEGVTVSEQAALQAGTMPEAVIADIAAQTLEGLVYLHKYRHTVSCMSSGRHVLGRMH